MARRVGSYDLDQPVWGLGEVAQFLGISVSNVRKTLEKNGVKPYAEIALGPIWRARDVRRMQERRLADESARDADERRRATARARTRS